LAACSSASAPTAAPKAAAPTTAPAAVAPTSAPAAAAAPKAVPATDAFNAEWDKIVAAAQQEKTVSIATYSGGGQRKVMETFQAAFPGVQVEHQQFQSSSRDYVPRLLQELKAGVYTWDLAIMPVPEMIRLVKKSDGLDPIRPILVRPDVLDDSSWVDGFEGGFSDIDKKWGYAICRYLENQLWINTDMVSPDEFKSIDALLDPKWKGKILGGDVRTKGSAFLPITALRVSTGREDFIEKFYKGQEVTILTDTRQLAEMMVRGRYPIGLGAVDQVVLADFQAQGLGNQLKRLAVPELEYSNAGANAMFLLTKAPHPNAAQLFANWILSKDGVESWSKNTVFNSRRTDVAVIDPETATVKGKTYVQVDSEALLPEVDKTQELAKAILN
jgi:iron(III) transport system substrate-binding protein